jgi:hypothetical protein
MALKSSRAISSALGYLVTASAGQIWTVLDGQAGSGKGLASAQPERILDGRTG